VDNVERNIDALEEDLIQISDPEGAFTVDVGWYPAGHADGEFICRLVEARDWDEPLEAYSTRELADVVNWVDATLTKRLNPASGRGYMFKR
jgi:hypothetical protein